MAVIGKAFGLVGKALFGGKKPAAPTPLALPSRNAAADALLADDRLTKRRGAATNAILGARGAEAGIGSKPNLGL